MPPEQVGILIPACDAAATVEEIVRGALAHAAEVLVVDDGSSDRSADLASAEGARVLRHGANRGKGAALATGFADLLARGVEAVVTLDADGQHDPADIPRFVETWRRTRADLIVGARPPEALVSMSGTRRFGNRFSCAAVRFFRGPSLPDTQCGFRLYGSNLLKQVRSHRRGYDAEIDLLMRAHRGGFRVVSLRIHAARPDGRATSHYRPWLDTYRICRTVVFGFLLESRLGR